MPKIAELKVIEGQLWARVEQPSNEDQVSLMNAADIRWLKKDTLRLAIYAIEQLIKEQNNA